MKHHIFFLLSVNLSMLTQSICSLASDSISLNSNIGNQKTENQGNTNISEEEFIKLAERGELDFEQLSNLNKTRRYRLPFSFIPDYVHRNYPTSEIKRMINFNVKLLDVVEVLDIGDHTVTKTMLSIDHLKHHKGLVNLYAKRGKSVDSMRQLISNFDGQHLPEDDLSLCQIAILYNNNESLVADMIEQEPIEHLEEYFPTSFRLYFNFELGRREKTPLKSLGQSIGGHNPMTFAHKFKLGFLIDLLIEKGLSLDTQTKSGKHPEDYYNGSRPKANKSYEIIDLRDFP